MMTKYRIRKVVRGEKTWYEIDVKWLGIWWGPYWEEDDYGYCSRRFNAYDKAVEEVRKRTAAKAVRESKVIWP